MDVNVMQGSGGSSGAGNQHQLEQHQHHHFTSSSRPSSSQTHDRPTHFHRQHRPHTSHQPLQHPLHLPGRHAVAQSIEQTPQTWAGTNVPLPFNLNQFHEQNLSPLRPCDGTFNTNSFMYNTGPLSDSGVQYTFEQHPAHPGSFYNPPHSAPISSLQQQGAFATHDFQDMPAFSTYAHNDVAESVKQNARSTPNIYRNFNGAPFMKRTRSGDLKRHSAEPTVMPTRKAPSRGATAEPPAKRARVREYAVAGPDPLPEVIAQTATPQPEPERIKAVPDTATADAKPQPDVATSQPVDGQTAAPADETQPNVGTSNSSTNLRIEPAGTQSHAESQTNADATRDFTHPFAEAETTQPDGTTARSRRATTKAKNAATAAAAASTVKKQVGVASQSKKPNVSEESWANILKYSTPEQDLDWTKEPDKTKRRAMQMVIASRVRADKKKAEAQQKLKSKPGVDATNTVAGSSNHHKDAANNVTDSEADAEHVPDDAYLDPTPKTTPSKSTRTKIAKIPLPKQNQPIAANIANDSSTMPYPSPDELPNSDDPALANQSRTQQESREPTPQSEEDEEVLRLKAAHLETLIKLKTIEHKRRREQEGAQLPANKLLGTSFASSAVRPYRDIEFDKTWVEAVKLDLKERRKYKKGARDYDIQSSNRIHELLERAQPPDHQEALFLTGEEAAEWVKPNQFFQGIIVTEGQQSAPLQGPMDFLNEYPDDGAEIWIQDPAVKLAVGKPHARLVTVKQVKERLGLKSSKHPWNCLELATHFDDGLRPAFLNNEDCRLLTKLKIPGDKEKAARRGFEEGWKEVEKWALVAQAGALTEPHQDSHGYSTFITVNKGPIGFGWLSNPTSAERKAWNTHHGSYEGGRWRYIVLRAGQTVYFPSGTVHFVFRLTSAGNTLAYGGHVLRCSQIVRWVKTLLEEQAQPNVTNEDLSQSAPGYLERVEKFVKHARRMGQQEKWGGPEAFDEFIRLKQKFNNK